MNLFGRAQAAAIMGRVALLFAVFAAASLPAPAQSDISPRVLWFGVYTVSSDREVDDPTSPSGKRYLSTPVPPPENTIQIPARSLRFGFGYVLSGNSGSIIPIKQVYKFPPPGMPDNAGGFRQVYEYFTSEQLGRTSFMGWSFEGATTEHMPPGEWTFQIWQGERLLIEQRFVVVRP